MNLTIMLIFGDLGIKKGQITTMFNGNLAFENTMTSYKPASTQAVLISLPSALAGDFMSYLCRTVWQKHIKTDKATQELNSLETLENTDKMDR